MKKYFIIIAIVILFTLPLWMWLGWLLEGKKVLKVVMVDKTSLTPDGIEHRSFDWILKHEKYCKANHSFYSISEDYYGFFPKENKQYEIKGLENLSEEELNKLARKSDMVYFNDTYGIYRQEWYGNNYRGELSPKIYGGLTQKEMNFLQQIKEQHKLILTEYNVIATPTPENVRRNFENSFGIKWSGWVGRYFATLDTMADKEIPVWLIENYKLQHDNKWPFKTPGIILVHDSGRIEILEYDKDLTARVPSILTNEANQNKYGVPEKTKFPYWFDIMLTSRSNEVVSVYYINTTARGDSILNSINIPNPFPAVIKHIDKDYKFYYFCGDFSDNPIGTRFTNFWGITNFRILFYSSSDYADRTNFFWLYYEPMVSTILDEYYNSLPPFDQKN